MVDSRDIEKNPKFHSLKNQRMLVGLLATVLTYALLYCALCITHEPNLESHWGIDFGWQLWTGEKWWKLLLAMLFMLLVTLSSSSSLAKGKHVKQLYPEPKEKAESESDIKLPAHISADKIVSLTMELAEQMDVEIKGVYVGIDPTPNAFTTFAVETGNIVFINSNLLDILDEQSIRAVIAHELGHVKNKDVLHRLGILVPKQVLRLWLIMLIIQLLGVLLLSSGGWDFLQRATLVIVSLSVYGVATGFVERFEKQYSRIKEKMADAYAVEYTSFEGMVNGFVRLNDRSHTLKTFLQALKEEGGSVSADVLQEALNIFPRGNKSSADIQQHAARYYAHAHLNLLLQKLSSKISLEDRNTWVQKMLQNKKQENDKKAEKKKAEKDAKSKKPLDKKPFVWQDFDWNHDGLLQRDEILAMVAALKENPTAMTSEEEKDAEHPPVRDRILFLADMFGG